MLSHFWLAVNEEMVETNIFLRVKYIGATVRIDCFKLLSKMHFDTVSQIGTMNECATGRWLGYSHCMDV